ncbi:MAG: hypothetical protein AB2374_17630 [Cytobacillus gottheilii]|uniref:hypothetical protein n=1 Tax=Cytobacillus gottheilii TaxID=859144 RepID=UPI003463FC76
MKYEYLLNQYKSLWQNRQLITDENTPEQVLKMTIQRELLDENAHPRVRKPLYEKFYQAIKRINESSLVAEDKEEIISIHISLMEQLRK